MTDLWKEGIRLLISCLIVLASNQVFGQDTQRIDQDSIVYQQEIRFVIDNDVFISLISDSYYSSGLFLHYRHLIRETEKAKMIRSYSLNQRIYTPRKLIWRDVERYDRPYAGHLSLFASNEYYFRKGRYLKTQVELGWMGPGTQTDDIQTNWHAILGLPTPRGWQYQIQNSPIVNFYSTYAHTWVAKEKFDLVTESNLALGTAFNNLRQEVMIRVGKLKSIYRSVHFNGVLGEKVKAGRKNRTIESYLFFSPGLEYNIYNTTIEGNLLGKEPPHTEDAVRWI